METSVQRGPAVSRPVPRADDVSERFWQAARDHVLLVQRCSACSRLQYPPETTCQRCHHDELRYEQVSGRGSVYSYAVVDRAFHPGFAGELPYVVALVELAEDPAVRLFTDIVGTPPAAVTVGMPVTVCWTELDGATLPVFRPVAP